MSGNNNSIPQIKNHFKLSSYISKFIEVKQHGNVSKALCPFHNEKTPSFTIDDQKKTYHCFGCGAHGDLINFVVEHEGLSQKDAINRLAHEAGIANDFKPSSTYQVQKQEKPQRINLDFKPIVEELDPEKLEKNKQWIKSLNESLTDKEELDNYLGGRFIKRETYENESLFIGTNAGHKVFAIPLSYPNNKNCVGWHTKPIVKNKSSYPLTYLTKANPNPYIHVLNQQAQPEYIFICEGVETGLSIKQIFENFNPMIYCCTSATNLKKFIIEDSVMTRSLKAIVVACDDDEVGIKAGKAQLSYLKLKHYTKRVQLGDVKYLITKPSLGIDKSDYNDVLKLRKGEINIICNDIGGAIKELNNLFQE